MPFAELPGGADRSTELTLVESAWQRIKAHLEQEKQRIYGEIKHYPRPIPACDLQFNQLLEERAGISQELQRVHEAVGESLGCGDPRKALADFLNSSRYVDDRTKGLIRSSL
jgi:hypothetical protein